MKRVGSIKEAIDIALELPAGAAPYEEFDFEPYFEDARKEEELRKTWRVFTKVKDVLDNGRRLENASWRLWFKERRKVEPALLTSVQSSPSMASMASPSAPLHASGLFHKPPPQTPAQLVRSSDLINSSIPIPDMPPPAAPPPAQGSAQLQHEREAEAGLSSLERYDVTLDTNLRRAEEETDRIVGDMFGGVGQRFPKKTLKVVAQAKAERTRALVEVSKKHELTDAAMNDILRWSKSYTVPSDELRLGAVDDFIPADADACRTYLNQCKLEPRKRVAAFCHSLERNGANNFLLYLVRELRDDMSFELVSPKDGAMRADYEAIGVPVAICNMKLATYPHDVRRVLSAFQYVIANTIMTTEVVNAARHLGVPCLWVIHEAWPRSQFDYYAKEVFMMTHLDSRVIEEAFANASKIVFPARVQRRCYEGLFDDANSRVIYNGIPLASINAFRTGQSRHAVRAELGYGPDDMLLVHMGTVCRRKAQSVTCQAFAELYSSSHLRNGKNWKLLLVGARYIRQHEVEYIKECNDTLESVGADKSASIIDVQKNVLPYYLAADIVLCPSMNEVLPLVICEAMAFQRPVIASRIDGIPEAMTDGVEGLLVEAGNVAQLYDAIEMLGNDDARRTEMGIAGRKRVLSQFSFETMSKTYRKTIGVDLNLDLSSSDSSSQG